MANIFYGDTYSPSSISNDIPLRLHCPGEIISTIQYLQIDYVSAIMSMTASSHVPRRRLPLITLIFTNLRLNHQCVMQLLFCCRCKRALLETVSRMQAIGHDMVEFKPIDAYNAATLLQKCLMPDNGAYFMDSFRDEDVDPFMKATYMAMKVGSCNE